MGNVASGEPMRHRKVWLFHADAAVMEMLLLSVPLTGWNTHWDRAWQCSAESLSHSPRSLYPPVVARERCSVVSWWSVLLHRSLSRTTTATTNSTLRSGELGISNIKHIRQRYPLNTCHVLSSRFPLSQIVTDMYNLRKQKEMATTFSASKHYVMPAMVAHFQRCSKMLAPVFMSLWVNYPPVVRLIQSLTQMQCNVSCK